MERAVYRIIDANFNRAREALRVIEDFCRFALNSATLTERAKKLRHELSAAINMLDAGKLLASRDTRGDVGVGKVVEPRFARVTLKDGLIAGCKRLAEALRTLSEMSQTVNPSVAQTVEKLRFDAYALEKDIAIFGEPAEKFRRVALYVIITSNLPADVIFFTHKCAAGGADCVQLRTKGIDDVTLFATAAEFVKICRAAGVLSIINDRVDIAVAAGADGVHLGQNDLPVEQARKLQLTPLIIGKTTHSLKQLSAACSELPTYVSIGPVFTSETKPDVAVAGLDYIREAKDNLVGSGIGNVAIGGITLDNVEEILNAGAGAIAVCSAVAKAADPSGFCRKLKDKILAFKKDIKS
jgi:thiamine-phosphate pyrophosphorylase